ncbi:MAG TPA: BON domain-containing protein [Caulobacteraceae bacterium]
MSDRWDERDDAGRYDDERQRRLDARRGDDGALGYDYGPRASRPATARGSDYESRGTYGGYSSDYNYAAGRRPQARTEPRSYRDYRQEQEGVYGPTWREAEANRQLFRSEEAIDYGGYPYGDLARRTGSFGAGGGYAANPNEGYARHGRDFWDRAGDEVASWFGDRGAEHRRAMDVAESHRGRGPKGYQRSDARIHEDVNDRLTDDAWLDAREITADVQSGEVTLSGTVSDRHAKRRAEDIAESVSGVRHVQNNLRVSDHPGTVAVQTDPRVSAVSEGRDADEAARRAAQH